MATKLYVGGLAWATTDESLKAAFEQAGTVVSAQVIRDRATNRSKGFGFVEMSSDEEAQSAMQMFDGKEIDGRRVNVSEARPKEERPRGDFGGGRSRNDDNGSW